MSQNDLSIANADGATVRADINAALQAQASHQSGTTAPSTTYAYQFHLDTTAGDNTLYRRNAANTGYIKVMSFDETYVDTKTDNYTVDEADLGKTIAFNITAAKTCTLLAAATAGDGFILTIKKVSSNAVKLTIDGNASETIDGATTIDIADQYAGLVIACDGSNWHVVGAFRDDDSYVLTDGATIDWDVEAGPVSEVTLAGNRIFNAVTGAKEGGHYTLVVIQDGTGSRTMTWNSNFDFGATGAPTLTTTASARDVIPFVYSNSKMRAGAGQLGFTG